MEANINKKMGLSYHIPVMICPMKSASISETTIDLLSKVEIRNLDDEILVLSIILGNKVNNLEIFPTCNYFYPNEGALSFRGKPLEIINISKSGARAEVLLTTY